MTTPPHGWAVRQSLVHIDGVEAAQSAAGGIGLQVGGKLLDDALERLAVGHPKKRILPGPPLVMGASPAIRRGCGLVARGHGQRAAQRSLDQLNKTRDAVDRLAGKKDVYVVLGGDGQVQPEAAQRGDAGEVADDNGLLIQIKPDLGPHRRGGAAALGRLGDRSTACLAAAVKPAPPAAGERRPVGWPGQQADHRPS